MIYMQSIYWAESRHSRKTTMALLRNHYELVLIVTVVMTLNATGYKRGRLHVCKLIVIL